LWQQSTPIEPILLARGLHNTSAIATRWRVKLSGRFSYGTDQGIAALLFETQEQGHIATLAPR
jgi:hypothetical protein